MACSLRPEFFYLCLCKCSSAHLPCNSYVLSQASPFPCPKHVLKPSLSRLLVVNPSRVSSLAISFSSSRHETPQEAIEFGRNSKIRPGFSSSSLDNKRIQKNLVKTSGSATARESVGKGVKSDGKNRRRLDSANRRKKESGFSSDSAKNSKSATNSLGLSNSEVGNRKIRGKTNKDGVGSQEVKGKKGKWPKKSKANPVDTRLRVKLEMCSKAGDVMGAIALYDSATSEGIKLGQYHYTMLLYLCSSAAMGVVQPAKSGSGSRSVDRLVASSKGPSLGSVNGSMTGETTRVDSGQGASCIGEIPTNSFVMGLAEENFDREAKSESHSSEGETEDEDDYEDENDDKDEGDVYNDTDMKEQISKQKKAEIYVSESVKKYALERGFEIYERMCLQHIPMNEAALTSVARMAMAMGDGDKAFDMVKQMKALGINPKLRSYGPALSMFCSKGEVEKAFEVEKHMLDHGVQPEEPELEALLRVCINVGKSDKIYYLLHKLRTTVRSVSPSTADLIESWFASKEASRVGKRKWDPKMIVQTMESVGGGWHGQGWLGSGKWSVSHTVVEADGLCKCCGEKLALIDLDPEETEKFAESVAAIASKREKNSSFQKFQRWLDYYGPFEAVVDAANIGLFSQKKFKLSKVKAVVNGIRQMLTSRKWPLVVLYNRRITGPKMNEPVNRAIIERWKNADALYATPTGSNDDWYWLYAAIKFRCLIVTNDEMRDHIFQLLGNDFFPRWKERHQVRFSFSEVGPLFHMPPPCSVVIQESERGHWHIPIASEHKSEGERTWLCIRRIKSPSRAAKQDPLPSVKASPKSEEGDTNKEYTNANSKSEGEMEDKQRSVRKEAQETYGSNINIHAELVSPSYRSILADIQSAEEQSGCVIDFQI